MNNHNQYPSNPEVNQGNNKDWTTIVFTAVIGIIIGFGLGYFVFANEILAPVDDPFTSDEESNTLDSDTENSESNSAEDAEGEVESGATSQVPAGTLAITVDDQLPGERVQLDGLQLSEPAWVVTFTSTEDNSRPLRIIGAQYFEAGSYADASAYVAEGIIAGRTYFVALYQDDGLSTGNTPGGHIFNHETDRPFVVNGNWVMDSFTALSAGARG